MALGAAGAFLVVQPTDLGIQKRRPPVVRPVVTTPPVVTIVEAPAKKAVVPARPPLPKPPAQPSLVAITITSSPSGAAVFEGNKKLGSTPLTFEREQSAEAKLSLMVKKQDYSSRRINAPLDQDYSRRITLEPDFKAVPFDP